MGYEAKKTDQYFAKRGQRLVPVPLWLAPKLALYLAMRDRQVNNSDLPAVWDSTSA